MSTFDHLLNWKLTRGSHAFPGPDGGTCINEAALVAAGFRYRPIGSAENMPRRFSSPICHFAMELNDRAKDKDRQRLLPYVTRLACADTPKIEQERTDYIRDHTCGYPHGIPFQVGLKALDGALAIGRQADPFAPSEVKARMDVARTKPATVTEVSESAPLAADSSLFSKVKGWFAREKAA
jgi:hypothetical protein